MIILKTWQLTIKIGNEEPDEIALYDVQRILEGYLNVNRTFFFFFFYIVNILIKFAVF